jgi:iron complex outermembrane receptor protein
MKSRFSRVRLSVLSLAGLSVLTSHAESNSVGTLREVVVVASRFEESPFDVPVAVRVITREDIQKSAAMTVPDVLRMLGGVNVRSMSGGQLGVGAVIDLGGFGVTATQNTLILVDGRRLNPIDSSEIDWSAVPLSSVQRIEVAQGGAGVQYGAGASGGVVQIVTDAKRSEGTEVGLRVGSFGTAQANVNLDRQVGTFAYSVKAGANESEGWRENSQARSQNLSVKAKNDLGADGIVFGEVLLSHGSNGFSGGVLGLVGEGNQQAAKFNNAGSENVVDQQVLRFGGSAFVSNQTTVDVDLSVANKRSVFKKPYYDTADSLLSWAVANNTSLDGSELSFSPKVRTEFSNGASVVYGLDFSQSKQDGAGTYGSLAQQFILANQGFGFEGNLLSDRQSVQLASRSVYGIARIPVNPAVEVTVGVRRQLQGFDSYDLSTSVGYAQAASGTFGATAQEAGLNIKLSDMSRTYLRANQSFRFANTDEYWGYDPATFNRVFSGSLRPQLSKAYEWGYDFKSDGQQLSVVLGQSVTQGEIRYDPITGNNINLPEDVFRNSLAAHWSVQVLAKSRATVGARLQRAEYATGVNAGRTLSMVPSSIYNLGWIQDFDNNVQVGAQVLHVSQQAYDGSPTQAQMPEYTTADLFVERRFGKLEAKVTVKNLTNSNGTTYGGYGKYVSLPAGGSVATHYYYPSDPRSVFLSLNYHF